MSPQSGSRKGKRRLDMAFEFQGVDGNYKWVLVVMARFGNTTGYCWASQSTIAEVCCISRSTVHRAIKRLTKLGLITAVSNPGRCTIKVQAELWKMEAARPAI